MVNKSTDKPKVEDQLRGKTARRPKSATILFDLRIQKGVTRQTAAKATGVPYTTLGRLEQGTFEDHINLSHLRALARYYNQPLDVRHLLGVS